jgi:hypothetical protein
VGVKFQNPHAPTPMFQVGNPGDVGVAHLADIMFTTHGPAPGAVMLRWYVAGRVPGDSGVWDVHFRIGGAVGTGMNATHCNITAQMNNSPQCLGVHTLFHIALNASVYVENMWGWVADHDIDDGAALNIFSPRGMLVETQRPVWLYGTAMEHSYLYQYNLRRSQNVLCSILQTETPYYQPQFILNASAASDPGFYDNQTHAFSIYAGHVANIALYGVGMYSFFDRWNNSACSVAKLPSCQTHISVWDTLTGNVGADSVRLLNYNTHGSQYIMTINGADLLGSAVPNGFCDTVSIWEGEGGP